MRRRSFVRRRQLGTKATRSFSLVSTSVKVRFATGREKTGKLSARDPKVTFGMFRIRKVFLLVSLVAVSVLALWFSAPVWVTPIAKLWYKPGFEEAVTEALSDLPDYESACIYDDTTNIFVTSVGQLNVERMIEKAARDNGPKFRLNALHRDPHFRVYSGGHTYYWSFRNEKFHPFWRDRWTLAGTIKRSCEAYNRHPNVFKQAYREREGIAVTEENFCCQTGIDSLP